mmetsp:Transcript_4909/g.9369  ORF Transcript_4909/g.9369 Transcript_4909/m.9369 type:complete len:138 (+) Transcript_4909:2347-2760(+)
MQEDILINNNLCGRNLIWYVYIFTILYLLILTEAPKSSSCSPDISQRQDSRYLDEVEFASITKDKEPYEVCRTFLASLMLCNSENISLTCHATREHVEGHHVSSPDDLFIKILNKDFQTPLSTSYLATSIDTLEQVI